MFKVSLLVGWPYHFFRILKWKLFCRLTSITRREPTKNSLLVNQVLDAIGAGSEGSYLEIGVQDGATLHNVNAKVKVGVDPHPLFKRNSCEDCSTFKTTSNKYFHAGWSSSFDLIFLDGYRTSSQFTEDLIGAAACLKARGLILIDGTFPTDLHSTYPSMWRCYFSRARSRGGFSKISWEWYSDIYLLRYVILRLNDSFRIATVTIRGHHITAVKPTHKFFPSELRQVMVQVLEAPPGLDDVLDEIRYTDAALEVPEFLDWVASLDR